MRRLFLPSLLLGAALLIAACSGGGSTTAAPSAAASVPPASDAAAACAKAPADATPNVNVEIKDFAYAPQPVQAKVGDVVAWTNGDSAPHTASLADGSCGTDQLGQGATGALVFNVAGTYTYQCNVHPGQMKDYTVEVK
ncbi:MAG TPA: plastocyanin/azurin family copper-binding protein [Candidatus Limnocylindrales bacterium]|nr:plastocyanin/azurin family copper-binding protein [Candidatus Limnocylindrales bacterium]